MHLPVGVVRVGVVSVGVVPIGTVACRMPQGASGREGVGLWPHDLATGRPQTSGGRRVERLVQHVARRHECWELL